MFNEDKHPRDKDGKFTDKGNSGSSNSEIKASNSGVKYGKDIKVSKQEYAVLRKEVIRKYSDEKNRKAVDCAYTANYFYIYRVSDYESFTPISQVFIEGNQNIINKFMKKWGL